MEPTIELAVPRDFVPLNLTGSTVVTTNRQTNDEQSRQIMQMMLRTPRS